MRKDIVSNYTRNDLSIGEVIIASLIGSIVGALVILLIGLPFAMLNGFVFEKLWGWFISPTFGLPLLSFWLATGILYTFRFAANWVDTVKKTDEPHWGKTITISILSPLGVLLLGYIIHLFV